MAKTKTASLGIRAGQHEATRERILATAWKLLLKNGFENVTMLEIAQKVGCSRQRLYDYFPSLEEIIYTLQIENMRSSLQAFNEPLTSLASSPSERLLELVDKTFAYQKEHPESPLFTFYFDHYYSHRPSKESNRRDYLALFQNEPFAKEIPLLIKEGIAKGEFRSDLSIDEAADFWSNMNQSLVERLSIYSVNGESHSEEERAMLRHAFKDALFRYLK